MKGKGTAESICLVLFLGNIWIPLWRFRTTYLETNYRLYYSISGNCRLVQLHNYKYMHTKGEENCKGMPVQNIDKIFNILQTSAVGVAVISMIVFILGSRFYVRKSPTRMSSCCRKGKVSSYVFIIMPVHWQVLINIIHV